MRLFVAAVIALLGISPDVFSQVIEQTMRITVRDETLHDVSPLLFGHFIEHANWHGETGPDPALIEGDRLHPRVMELVASLKPTTLRFPGGTLVCSTDWLDYIDHAPAGQHDRWGSSDVQVGYTFDDFLRDCQAWGAEPVLVVNFKQALMETESLEDCAKHAAALVAYCNLSVDADAPEELLFWARLRARNGHLEPYGVKYFQIGNEIWAYVKEAKKTRGDDYPQWHAQCLDQYITELRAVDPGIILISDPIDSATNDAIRKRVGDRLDYMTAHAYGPWGLAEIKRGDEVVNPKELSEADVWRAFVSVCEFDPDTGMSLYPLAFDVGPSGYPIAATEWNWNGYWRLKDADVGADFKPFDSYWAKGIGAAGFLHGLIRAGDRIHMAHQSMLIGTGWGITSVRIPKDGPGEAFLVPSGAITGFYARHHGDHRLDVGLESVPVFAQPYSVGTLRPHVKVAAVDTLVTADEGYIYIHLLGRRYEDDTPIQIDLTDLKIGEATAVLHLLSGELESDPSIRVAMQETSDQVEVVGGVVNITLPPRVVACLQVPR